MTTRVNPDHWIWQQEAPHRFEPDEESYVALRSLMTAEQTFWTEQLLGDGLSAEQVVILCGYDALVPPETVEVFGQALAYWMTRIHEECGR